MSKTVTISEQQFASLLAQASFLRAAVHALGGVYEVSFETLARHGMGEIEMDGDSDRRSVTVRLIQGPHEESPPKVG